eukprot:2297201-Amphidinium_carterae.1
MDTVSPLICGKSGVSFAKFCLDENSIKDIITYHDFNVIVPAVEPKLELDQRPSTVTNGSTGTGKNIVQICCSSGWPSMGLRHTIGPAVVLLLWCHRKEDANLLCRHDATW